MQITVERVVERAASEGYRGTDVGKAEAQIRVRWIPFPISFVAFLFYGLAFVLEQPRRGLDGVDPVMAAALAFIFACYVLVGGYLGVRKAAHRIVGELERAWLEPPALEQITPAAFKKTIG